MTDSIAKGFVYMATSLDGFVAGENHSLDWLNKYGIDENDTSYTDFTSNIDAIVMGSGSFKTTIGFGPISYGMHVYVMSKTLTQEDVDKSEQDKVTIINTTPKELMKLLYTKGQKRIYVDGGKIVQSFINDGLIEEMTITQVPILIGKGKRLFGEVDNHVELELISSKKMKPCFLQNHYRIIK